MATLVCSNTPARTRSSQYVRERASRTMELIPCRCKRWDSMSPAGPAPTIPTCVSVRAIASLLRGLAGAQDFLGGVKCGVGCGNATVDGAMQQHFTNFLCGEAIIDGGPQVEAQLFGAIQRYH